jgi:hypothetical protein
VLAAVIETLEPLRGLANLTAVQHSGELGYADGGVGLEPIGGLPALEHVALGDAILHITSLAPLCSMPSLSSLNLRNNDMPQLDGLGCMSSLRRLVLAGFYNVTSMAPLGSFSALSHLEVMGFPLLSSLAPLNTLSMLRGLGLYISSSDSISLEPLCQLTTLTWLVLRGSTAGNRMTGYNLQPLSALSGTMRALRLEECVLRNVRSVASLGMVLRELTVTDCRCPPGYQHASLIPQVPHLTFLCISNVTTADVDSISQQLKCLQKLSLKRAADNVTSLAALASLTHLDTIALESCSHVSSIDPLIALTRLQSLHLISCPQLAGLNAFTALRSLEELRLEGCPQLEASLPTSMQRLLVFM